MMSHWQTKGKRQRRSFIQYIQARSSNVFHNDKCITYRIFKEVFEYELHLTLLPERLRILFTKFRLGNTKRLLCGIVLKQAGGSILIEIKGIVLCVMEMRLGMNFIYCFNVTL